MRKVLKEIFNSVPPPPIGPHRPPPCTIHHPAWFKERLPGASGLCQKHRLDVFYVQHCWLSWGRLWLFIYLFHSSRVIVPICYTKVLSSPRDSRHFYCRAPVCLWNSSSLSFKVHLRIFFFFLKSPLRSRAHSPTLSVLFCCSGSSPPRLPHLPHADPDWHAPPRGPVPLRAARAARHAWVSHLHFFLAKTEKQRFRVLKTHGRLVSSFLMKDENPYHFPHHGFRLWWEPSAGRVQKHQWKTTHWLPNWIINNLWYDCCFHLTLLRFHWVAEICLSFLSNGQLKLYKCSPSATEQGTLYSSSIQVNVDLNAAD